MEYIVIKLYLNEMQGDCYDIHSEDFEKNYKNLQGYAESINRRLYLAPMTASLIGIDPFAEVEYTKDLSQEEKQNIVGYIKIFFTDGKVKGRELEEFNTLKMVKFEKIEDGVFEIY